MANAFGKTGCVHPACMHVCVHLVSYILQHSNEPSHAVCSAFLPELLSAKNQDTIYPGDGHYMPSTMTTFGPGIFARRTVLQLQHDEQNKNNLPEPKLVGHIDAVSGS